MVEYHTLLLIRRRISGWYRQVAALHSDHNRQVPLYTYVEVSILIFWRVYMCTHWCPVNMVGAFQRCPFKLT